MRRTLLWLFAVALLSRVVPSVVRVIYGVPDVISFGVTGIYPIILYPDFTELYAKQLGYLAQGYLPYRDFPFHALIPLFLYVLYPFYAIGGAVAASIPIILSDALTTPVIYLIVRIYASNRIAWAASLAYAFSPLVLIYEGFLWFNSQPMTFFIMLSVYLLKSKKLVLSSASLAIAILFKQQAVFILPLLAIWYLREYKKKGLEALMVIMGIIALVSIPFLLISYRGYIAQVSYGVIDLGWVPTLQLALADSTSSSSLSPANQVPTPLVNCFPLLSNASGVTMMCTSKSSSYLQFVPYLPFLTVFARQLSLLIGMTLAILMIPALFVWRNKENALEISSAFVMTIFLILFSLVVHPDVRYYWIPVYCLLLAASRNSATLAIASGVPILSLLTPEFQQPVILSQQVLPLLAMLAIVVAHVISDNLRLKAGRSDPVGVAPT